MATQVTQETAKRKDDWRVRSERGDVTGVVFFSTFRKMQVKK